MSDDAARLSEILEVILRELSKIMGPAVVYGIAVRACAPLIEGYRGEVGEAWLRRYLPRPLFEKLAESPPAPPRAGGPRPR